MLRVAVFSSIPCYKILKDTSLLSEGFEFQLVGGIVDNVLTEAEWYISTKPRRQTYCVTTLRIVASSTVGSLQIYRISFISS